MTCETFKALQRFAIDTGWSRDMLLLLTCQWAEDRGFENDLTDHLARLAPEAMAQRLLAVAGGADQQADLVTRQVESRATEDLRASPVRLRIFADLSTAHLTEDLARWLEEECQRRSFGEATEGMPSVWNLGTGFFIWIPDPEFDHPDFDRVVDPILKRILEYAREAGADYVLLDRDADTCDALPVFDW